MYTKNGGDFVENVLNDNLLKNQLNWLSNLILPGGESIMNNKSPDSTYKIIPYFSNIASLALLEDPTKLSQVKKYLIWYVTHLNRPDKHGVNGTIYDYWVRKNNELVSTKDYDSYDSYPATFLTLCLGYFQKSNDKRFFDINRKNIDLITDSLITSMDSDYLTWAKPDYKIKYLMDNCEVYEGLINGSKLYSHAYSDNQVSQKLLKLAEQNYDSIENNMWKKDYYCYLIDNGGKGSKPDYNTWYADATSQLFPILCGLIKPESDRAKFIYNNFNVHHSDWHKTKKSGAFPDAYIGYIAALMNDYERVSSFLNLCEKNYINNNNLWPWYNVECSYFIRTYINYAEVRR